MVQESYFKWNLSATLQIWFSELKTIDATWYYIRETDDKEIYLKSPGISQIIDQVKRGRIFIAAKVLKDKWLGIQFTWEIA